MIFNFDEYTHGCIANGYMASILTLLISSSANLSSAANSSLVLLNLEKLAIIFIFSHVLNISNCCSKYHQLFRTYEP